MTKTLKQVVAIFVVVAAVYYANRAVQSYLGEQAIDALPFAIYSLHEAKTLAAEQNKLVLADYSAVWCPTCRKLDKEIFSDERVAAIINDNFVFAKLDHETAAGRLFAKQHDLVGFPRVLALDTEGNKLTELPLTFEAANYQANLSKVVHAFK